MSNLDKIYKLYSQLFPTGRAFRFYEDGNNARLHKTLAITRANFYNDTLSTLNSILPDNDKFTPSDADDWERRLGMPSNPLVDIEIRKAAIRRKMASPGINPARSGAAWLEYQLQQAGFSVYVYENAFPSYPSGSYRISPDEFNATILSELQHGMFEHGQVQHGSFFNYIIGNSLDNDDDIQSFNNLTDFGASFFIGGATFGSYGSVPTIREQEFRALVLSQKQTQQTAFCFINFT